MTNPKIRISDPTCRHKARGFVGWGDHRSGPYASTHCCAREACVEDAALWVKAITGHLGEYTAFATFETEA